MTTTSRVISRLFVVLLSVTLFVALSVAGCGESGTESKKEAGTAKTVKANQKADLKAKKAVEDRYNVPLGNRQSKGPENALVTIVEISEFQCPFCSRVLPTIKKIMDTYKGKVRVVWVNNPLPFHKDAGPASEAALAAGEQGKFWEMHDKLFANQKQLKRDNLDSYAKELGLDMDKFAKAMDSGKFKAQIKKDQELAKRFAARGTPHFFVNGIRVKGARPFDSFKTVIDAELKKAEKFKNSKNIYAEVVKGAKTKADAPKKNDRRKPQEDKNIYKVATGDKGSAKGNVDGALITIVEFSDYQCPFCTRAEKTVDQVVEAYGDKVRVFFRHNPLPFHKQAKNAAAATLAARNQGKFWEMHQILFDNQKALKTDKIDEVLAGFAGKIGLNVAKFQKDMKSEAIKKEIEKDMAEAKNFGSRGTPGFFINGRKLVGAQPMAKFKTLIDELLKDATKSGKTGDALYAELTKNGKTKAEAPKRQNRPKEDPNKVYNVPAGSSYYKGGKNAKVEIIEFSEFQCPFCSRVIPTLKKLDEKYGNDIKVVFKHSPLPFHKDAPMASEAALAAGDQGKFWEMHDLLFKNHKQLKRENLETYAKELGLDMAKFNSALDSGVFKAQIAEDKKLAQKVGARGTPTFFINGKKLVGAQPFDAFDKAIQAALKAKK